MDHLSTRIRARWLVLTLALAGLTAAAIVMAQGAQGASVEDGQGIYQGTSGAGVTACAACHGSDGNGSTKLTGISKNIDEIIGKINSGQMQSIYISLTDDQRLSTACYVKETFDGGIPSADETRCGIAPANQAPVADPGGPYPANVGVAVNFNGSGSTDDDTIVSYDWDFGDGSIGTGINPTHAYTAPGTYTVSLKVTDNGSPALTHTAGTTATITDVTAPPVEGERYRAGPAGWVVLKVENGKLMLAGVDSAWDWRIDEQDDHELEITFYKDGTRVEFEAELKRGRVKTEIEVKGRDRGHGDDDHDDAGDDRYDD